MAELIWEAPFLALLGGKRLGIAAKTADAADLIVVGESTFSKLVRSTLPVVNP